MPITLLDIVLIVVMLISGLLAMVRGFMREVLSIIAWILAAGATLYAYSKLLPLAKQYFNNGSTAVPPSRGTLRGASSSWSWRSCSSIGSFPIAASRNGYGRPNPRLCSPGPDNG